MPADWLGGWEMTHYLCIMQRTENYTKLQALIELLQLQLFSILCSSHSIPQILKPVMCIFYEAV